MTSHRTGKLPINIEDLLRQRHVESERIEYKAGWNPDSVIRTLCAFANDFENLGGGYVVIGQECDGSAKPVFPPRGLDDTEIERIQQDLQTYCNLFQPPYFPLLSVARIENRKVLVLWAPGGQNRPYKAPRAVTASRKEYRYYIRRYSSTVEAKGRDEHELISLTASVPFDDRLHPTAKVGELSTRLITSFLEAVGSRLVQDVQQLPLEAIGRQMNIVGGPGEGPRPKNVGLLFFHPEPQQFFPVTQIDIVWFPDGAGGDRFEEKIFTGPLDRITRDALSFIQRNYLREIVLKSSQRPEADRVWNFPFQAVEEAVVNAVYHRSYEIREPIEVRIDPEAASILSFPGPDRSIRLQDLAQGKAVTRRYRNRRIGEFLKELGLREGRSTGISKILRVMRENGSPAPEFQTDDDRTYFLTRFPVHPLATSAENLGGAPPKLPPKLPPKSPGC